LGFGEDVNLARSTCPTHVQLFGRERSTPNPRRIRLDDPNNLLDNSRWDTQARTDPSDRGGRRGHVRVSPVIEVEHEGVGAFDEDAFVLLDGFVQEGRAVDDVRAETFGEFLPGKVFGRSGCGSPKMDVCQCLKHGLTKYF
jgi:hypothetical protein